MPKPDQEKKLAELDAALAAVRATLDTQKPELDAAQMAWEATAREQLAHPPQLGTWQAVGPFKADNFDSGLRYRVRTGKRRRPGGQVCRRCAALGYRTREWADAVPHDLPADVERRICIARSSRRERRRSSFHSAATTALRVWHDGKEVFTRSVRDAVCKPDQDKVTLQLHPGANHLLLKVANADGGARILFPRDRGRCAGRHRADRRQGRRPNAPTTNESASRNIIAASRRY